MVRSRAKKLFSEDFWKAIFGIALLLAILLLILALYLWYGQYQRFRELDRVTKAYVDSVERAYRYQGSQNPGGKTPRQVLFDYHNILELGDYRLASTYFVKDARKSLYDQLTFASRSEILQYIELLKKESSELPEQAPTGDRFQAQDPLPIQFKEVNPGVWQIESIDYNWLGANSTGH